MSKTLTCIDCGGSFPYVGGRPAQRCPECRAVYAKTYNATRQRQWRRANPDKAKAHWNKSNRKRLADPEHRAWKREDAMRRAYGIGQAEFDALLESQGGVCAVCGGERNGPGKRFHVDHCHNSNRIRGLLCGKCNTAIGLLDDDPERAEKVAAYLRR